MKKLVIIILACAALTACVNQQDCRRGPRLVSEEKQTCYYRLYCGE